MADKREAFLAERRRRQLEFRKIFYGTPDGSIPVSEEDAEPLLLSRTGCEVADAQTQAETQAAAAPDPLWAMARYPDDVRRPVLAAVACLLLQGTAELDRIYTAAGPDATFDGPLLRLVQDRLEWFNQLYTLPTREYESHHDAGCRCSVCNESLHFVCYGNAAELKRGEPDSDVFCMVCMAHRKDDCAGLTGDLADVCAMPLGTGLTKCYVNACVAELSRRAAAGCPVQYSPLRRRALKVAAQPGAARGAPEVTEAELTALLEAAGMEHWRVRGNLHTIPGQRAVGRKITRSTAEAVWSASDGHAAAEQLVECTRAGYYAQFQMPLDALDLGGAPASVRRLIEGMVARRAREPRNRAWGGQRVLSLVRTTMFLLGLLTCWTGWHLDPGGAWNDLLLVRLDEPDKNLATRRRAAPAAASSGGLREAVERIVAGTSASAGPEDATGHSGAWWGTLHIAALPAMLRVLGTPRVPEGLWCLHDFKLVAAEVNRDMGGDYMYVVEQSAATSCVHVEVGCMHMVKNCVADAGDALTLASLKVAIEYFSMANMAAYVEVQWHRSRFLSVYSEPYLKAEELLLQMLGGEIDE